MGIRVRALYQNSQLVLILIVAFCIGATVIGCWAVLSSNFTMPDSMVLIPPSPGLNVGCPSDLNLTFEQGMCMLLQSDSRNKISDISTFSHTVYIDLAVAWSTQLVFDTFIFLLTLMRSLHIRKERSRSIVEIILRDGSLYFAIMCIANVVNVTMLLVAKVRFRQHHNVECGVEPFLPEPIQRCHC
ncbi:hypothetical protein SCLCIDRAFT_286578 [Scleroderma citrinum Foug A]|uniref:Uncharacterized protein n=1 Tax=Scleroderma citrinum Foug A TaxID=1036808 RepID=A0A0C2ZT69_9AGAM|nr:hypothetical protein SCLCIDRAFT_286578 [Scleroderma citrinum Foug A]